jgi:peptidoglycan/xylan/chitin deacetylase (PgdA/CDA1 family)
VKALQELFAGLLRFSGLPYVIREVFTRNRCAIILYHDPDPMVFEAHLGYLAKHYSIIPFSTLVSAIDNRDWSQIPPRSLVIHIDDGYARNYRLLDTMQRFKIRPTLYLCSHVVASNRQFWSRLKNGTAKQLRLVENPQLLEKLRTETGFTPELETASRQSLSQTEIQSMAEQIDFQSHGRYHFSLLTLDDEELKRDLSESMARTEELTGQPCRHFSFPYGDYGQREIDQLRECGYRTARTTEPGWNTVRTDLFRLRVLADVPGDASVNALCMQLTGIPRFLKRLVYLSVTRHIYAWRQERLMQRRFF